MSSHRVRKIELTSNFTLVPNDLMLDPGMSGLAKWCVITYFSRPDGWRCSSDWLETVTTDGREGIRAALKMAEKCGYLVRRRYQGEGGRWAFESWVSLTPMTDEETDGIAHRSTASRTSVNRPSADPAISTKTGNNTGRKTTPPLGASRRSAAARPKSSRQPTQPDDQTASSEEAPAFGASLRQSRPDRDAAAAGRGTSGVGLAIRLRDGLARAGTTGSAATVDKELLGKRLAALVKAGTHTYELLGACVDVYVAAPTRYHSGGDYKGWTGFLAALPKLEADAAKLRRANAPASELYGDDPYAGVR